MLSIVLPTYNEAENLPELLERVSLVLKAVVHEVIVVDDDSPDRTWQKAEELCGKYAALRVIRRIGRKGLSSAVVEGFDAATGEVLLVMDSDLQHDPALIRSLYEAVKDGAGIAVASRYMKGGSVGEWVKGRRLLSTLGTWAAKTIPSVRVSDPMSGFFALDADLYRSIRSRLHPTGFKILFEVLGHLPSGTTAAEVPLVFRMRMHGESKLSVAVQLQFIGQLIRLALLRFQFALFVLVGVVIALLLLLRVWPLLPLYLHADLRREVQQTLQTVSDDNGWLLSDLSLRAVSYDGIRVVYRAHHRGPDESDCYIVPFDTRSPQPCAD